MVSPTKLVATTIVGTGVIGGSVGTYYALNNNQKTISIEKQLSKEGKTLIKGDDKSEQWTIKYSTYKKEIAPKNPGISLTTQDGPGLKKWCENNVIKVFDKESSNIYKVAKEICTLPTNKDKLLNADHTITSDWKRKIDTYKNDGKGENAIEKFNNTQPSEQQMREWCEEELEKEFKVDSEKSYKLTLKWCTVKGQ